MNDYLIRAASTDGLIRAFAATTKQTVNKAYEIHNTYPVATAAFGRLLTASAMLSSMLKNDTDLITLSIKGDGPMGGLLVTADNKANVKGYVHNSEVNIPLNQYGKLDVKGAIGEGTLTVTRDMGLKEPYSGQVPLVSGEIADDITYYYAKSEQIPTAVGLGVLVDTDYSVKHAGGFVIQLMPNCPDEIAEKVEDNVNRLPYITDLFDMGFTPEDLIKSLFNGIEYNIYEEKMPVQYSCNCSQEKAEQVILSIGKKELSQIIEEDKGANMHCHFCNTDYSFTEEQLVKLIENSQQK